MLTLFFHVMFRLIEKLKKVKDFRQASGKRHQLWVVLLIILLGIMQSYVGYRPIGDFAKYNQTLLTKYFKTPSRLRREFTYHLSLPQGFALISPFKGFSHSAIKVINEVKDASFELFFAHETASSE